MYNNEDDQIKKLIGELAEVQEIISENNISNPISISKTIMEIIEENKGCIEARLQISVDEIKEINGEIFSKTYDIYGNVNRGESDLNYPDYKPNRVDIVSAQISWFRKISNAQGFTSWGSKEAFKRFINEIVLFSKNIQKINIVRNFLDDGALLKLSTIDEINNFQDEVNRIKSEHTKITKELQEQGLEVGQIKDMIAELWSMANQLIDDINKNNVSAVSKNGKKVVKLLKQLGSPLVAIGVGVATGYIENKIR